MATSYATGFGEGRSINSPPMFDGTDYKFWKAKMRVFIQSQDYYLWHYTIQENHTPNLVSKKDLAILNVRAMGMLYNALEDHIFDQISSCSNAKTIWDHLESLYTIIDDPQGDANFDLSGFFSDAPCQEKEVKEKEENKSKCEGVPPLPTQSKGISKRGKQSRRKARKERMKSNSYEIKSQDMDHDYFTTIRVKVSHKDEEKISLEEIKNDFENLIHRSENILKGTPKGVEETILEDLKNDFKNLIFKTENDSKVEFCRHFLSEKFMDDISNLILMHKERLHDYEQFGSFILKENG